MLLTMEQAYKESYQAMPNPERIDKVTKFFPVLRIHDILVWIHVCG